MKRCLLLLVLAFVSFPSFGQAGQTSSHGKPLVIGETLELQSAVLSERRVLNVYLPEGYNEKDTTHYPVVYLLDGGLDEDFIHVVGLYQFNSFPWIARVTPSIVVGIANTDRKRDMTFPTIDTADRRLLPTAGGSDKFISFLERELQPYIQKRFKTNGSKTLIGESLAGLLAAEILLKRPAMFNRYIIVSPSLWWDNGSLLNASTTALQRTLPNKTTIYIGVGKEGLTPGSPPRVMEVDANVLADKVRQLKNKDLAVHFDYLPDEDHATIMHQAVFNAIRLMK